MSVILLVEDSSELAQQILTYLRQNGFIVFHAADGLKGLELHEAHCPDLVILDWSLPELNGQEVLEWLRQLSETQVLMLTENGRPQGLEEQADGILDKPFDMETLLFNVPDLLGDTTTPRESGVLTFGPLELEPDTYRALLQGVPVNLARAEFDLLQLLLRNPGRVFTRHYLVEVIWDGRYVPGDRSIDNLVLRLRKKLGTFGGRIESVWGEGYRLIGVEKQQETAH
jgi:DNA-binding response OmpR family regulator